MTRVLERPGTVSTGSSGSGFIKFLTGFVVLAVLGVAGYFVIAGRLPFQPKAPVTNTPVETRRIWDQYMAEYERDPQDRSGPAAIGQRTGMCLAGLPGTAVTAGENPGYAPTDRLGRATAAWVCIGASRPAPAPGGSRCTPTGTTRQTYQVTWVRGHLVSYWFGGDGLRSDGGGCQNIVPQSGSVNKQVADGPEQYAKNTANAFYVAVPHYGNDTPFPNSLYYFIFSEAGPPIQAWFFANN